MVKASRDSRDDRPPVYIDGDTVVYRASSLGMADHALVACRLGYDPLAWSLDTLRVMEEGVLHEPDIITRAAGDEYHIADEQKEVELPIAPGVVIRGHIDARFIHKLRDKTGGIVVDAKSMSSDVFADFRAHGINRFPRIAFQLSDYMIALDLPGMIAAKDRNSGKIELFHYTDPPMTFTDLKHRVLLLEAWARKGELLSTTDHPCTDYPCRWYHLHDDPVDEVIEDALIDALAKTYIMAREREDLAVAAKSEARKRLLEALGERDKAATARHKVTRRQTQRRRFNDKKAVEEIPDLERFYETSMTEQLYVSAVKEDER